jgi:ribonuclease PH
MRPSGRQVGEMRPVSIETGITRHAEGSCLIRCGDTHVLCTASVDERVPPFLKNSGLGWVTAEYGMLPRATHTRMRREAKNGQSGRTQEIQRLIGRSLRAGIDRVALGDPMLDHVAAVSCGIYAGQPVLDLDYPEDSEAGVDGNFVMMESGQLIEVQMSAEGATFSRDQMGTLLDLADAGVKDLVAAQKAAVS